MKNLNKDEKKYINDQLTKKLKVCEETYNRKAIDELVKQDILNNPMVKDAISFLEKTISKDMIKEFAKCDYFKTQGTFEYYNDKVTIKITPNLSNTTISEINRFEKIYNTLRDLSYNSKYLNFEKYYIIFSTWVAPNTERFNKINELIELIYKDLMV